MKPITYFFSVIISFSIISCKNEVKHTTDDSTLTEKTIAVNRIVSLSGAITETIAALGKGGEIVGRDVTSTYPTDLDALDLGHPRSMTIEPILSVTPTLVIASENGMNPDLAKKIKESGLKTEWITQEYSVEGTKNLIKNIAAIVGVSDFQNILDKIDADINQIRPIKQKPKVLFIYARGAGNLMVAGTGTPMDAIINLAGGQNAVRDFSDFKPLTPEYLIQENPDVILLFDTGMKSMDGIEGVLNVPGIKQTNAGKNELIISVDGGLLSSFGPRVGEAALELNRKLIKVSRKID